MTQKKVLKSTNKIKKTSEQNSDVLGVLNKPITTRTKPKQIKTLKTKSNNLYKKFYIKKDKSDRIDFDEIYNKQKRKNDSNINFIPQDFDTIPNQTTKKILLLIISSFSFLFIILCFIGLFVYKSSFNKEIIKLIDSNKKLDEIYAREKNNLKIVRFINNDLNYIDNIYSNHIYWTNFLSFLEKNIVKDVFVKDMFVESSGNLMITFRTNDYENVSKQIKIFQSYPNIVKNLTINQANRIDSIELKHNIDFKLLLEIDKTFLLK